MWINLTTYPTMPMIRTGCKVSNRSCVVARSRSVTAQIPTLDGTILQWSQGRLFRWRARKDVYALTADTNSLGDLRNLMSVHGRQSRVCGDGERTLMNSF